MKFIEFEGILKDRPTSEVSVRGIALNLHSEWNFVSYAHDLPSARMTLHWQYAVNPAVFCDFEFIAVESVRIEPRDPAYPLDHAQLLFMMIYQELEGKPSFMKFWFEDQSTIEIAAGSLTLRFDPEEFAKLEA